MLNLISNILPVLCLCIGFVVGYNMKNNRNFEVPEQIRHPHRYIKEKMKSKQDVKQIQEELDYLNNVLYNIENYDGTGEGQRTIKRGGSN